MMKFNTKLEFKNIKDLPIKVTDWIGSSSSIFVHTLFFVGIFVLYLYNVPFQDILLILTTVVSLEAIYLSIFIQMTVNRNTQSLVEVEEDIDEIQEDIDKLEEEEKAEPDTAMVLQTIENRLQSLINEIESLKKNQK
ncbi:MAG TPA: hypothetical protein VGQ87_02210 [Patescibacteria group bacterium]|nr:hypothetical protein [Patescibacteria group bacterium]